MKKNLLVALSLALACSTSSTLTAQFVITGGPFTLADNAFISVQDDLISNTDILGNGKIILNKTSQQQMNLNGFSISNLEINSAGVTLTGNAKVANGLNFVAGKIQTGNFNFTLSKDAVVTGAATGRFIETNGTGEVRKELDVAGTYILPVGAGNNYMPLQFDVSGGTIGSNAYVATTLVASTHPAKPVRVADNLTSYWKPSYNAITGATINATGSYVDGSSVNGDETVLRGIRYNGSNWSFTNNTINTTNNTVTYNNIPSSGTDLYAMNQFILVSPKVHLQGAFNTGTGKMNDALRVSNLVPSGDPYRTSPYNTVFTHVNNPTPEVVNAALLTDQGNDNDVVDWVFIQLRNTSNTVIQTRSAVLQKDGDIVEIDGNAVSFPGIAPGNYIVSIRHRNHLGIRSAAAIDFSSVSASYDFTTASNQSFQNQSYTSTIQMGSIWAMRGGNANSNNNVKYNGPGNDQNQILNLKLGGSLSNIINLIYAAEDINMNGNIKWNGPGNDQNFLLNTILGGSLSVVYNEQL